MAEKRARARNVDEYLAVLPQDVRTLLERLRQTILKAAPGIEEVLSYGMPAYKCHGIVTWFAAHTNYCGLYVRPRNKQRLAKDLKPFTASKSTIRFTVDKPLPANLVRRIVRESIRVNLEREKEKKRKS